MELSQIAKSISESATLKLNSKAAKLKKDGEPVIHLGGGEPKGKAPIDAIIAAEKHLKTGEIRYAPVAGTPALKNAIIEYTEKNYNRVVSAENVMASGGAKQAILVALQSVVNPKDEVIFPSPYWVSYPDMVKLAGGVPVLAKPGDENFYLSIQDIERRVTSRTKAIIINSPNNPTGVVYSKEFISDIVNFCEKKDIYLIMDDIYNRLIFDNKLAPNCYDFVNEQFENSKLIVVNGVSKAYAMTGFRIGWAVANKTLINAMTNIQAHQTSGPSSLSQSAAVGALNGDQTCVESLKRTLEENRNVMIEQLSALDKVIFTKPDATFYCFIDFSEYEKDSTKLSNFLIDKVQVLTVPGIEFGLNGYLRLSYCGSQQDITEGLERIRWALDPNSPKEFYLGDKKIIRDWE
jgi:aspartate aminotransferase